MAVLKPATSASATTDILYIHADHLGTPRKIPRPGDNRVVWSWESEAFGNSLPDQNPSGLGNFVFNLRFPGQYYDKETGLFYNYFRDYDPKTGRYIESDPIGLAGGINTYTYVQGNPIYFVDQFGLINVNPNAIDAENMGGGGGLGGGSARAFCPPTNVAQQAILMRFQKKIPANSKDSVELHQLPNDSVAAQPTSPGVVPGSKAVYEKQIDVNGNTVQATKTTYDPQGDIVHVKDKLNGGTFP